MLTVTDVCVVEVPPVGGAVARLVCCDGVDIGLVQKYATGRGRFPWVAYAMDRVFEGRLVAGTDLGSFYGRGGRALAVAACVAAWNATNCPELAGSGG